MRGTPIRKQDFSGGLNTSVSPFEIADNECRDCSNVQTNILGAINKRNGDISLQTTFTGGGTTVYSLAPYWVPGTTAYMICQSGTKFFKMTAGGTVTDITGATVPTQTDPWYFVMAPTSGGQGPLYGVSGLGAVPQQWTGAGNMADWTASAGTVPQGKVIAYWKNRIWIANTNANPTRLFWSDILDPRIWPAANVNDFDASDGEAITGLCTSGPYLLVFKGRKIYVIYDGDSGANRVLATGIGTNATRTILETPNGTFFFDRTKGVYVTNGKTLKLISDKITPSLLATANPNATDWTSAIYTGNHYYLSVAVGSAFNADTQLKNDTVFDYDLTTKSWWKHSNAAMAYANWQQPTSTPQTVIKPFLSYANTQRVAHMQAIANADNYSPFSYNTYWLGPWINVNSYARKRLRGIDIEGYGVLDASLAKDFVGGPALLYSDIFNFVAQGTLFGGGGVFGGVGTYGGTTQFDRKIYSLGVSKAFSLQIGSNSINPLEFDSYTFFFTPRGN